MKFLHSQLPGLFDGCHFYFHGPYEYPTPTKEELSALVKVGGASVLSREPKPDLVMDQSQLTVPYHAAPNSQLANCSYFIVHDNRNDTMVMVTKQICRVPASYVLDCIAQFKILDLN